MHPVHARSIAPFTPSANIYVENDVTFGGRVSCDETAVEISEKCRFFPSRNYSGHRSYPLSPSKKKLRTARFITCTREGNDVSLGQSSSFHWRETDCRTAVSAILESQFWNPNSGILVYRNPWGQANSVANDSRYNTTFDAHSPRPQRD